LAHTRGDGARRDEAPQRVRLLRAEPGLQPRPDGRNDRGHHHRRKGACAPETHPAVNAVPPPVPTRVALPSRRVIMTWLIIAVNVFVWLLMELNGGSDNSDTLITFGAKVNELIDQGQVWRLFTAMFLHIGIIHLAVNQ